MKIADSIRLSVSAIRSGFLRSLLTILSLAVGVAAVLTVLALGDAGELRVEEEIVKLAKEHKAPICGGSSLVFSKEICMLHDYVKENRDTIRGGHVTAPIHMVNPYGNFWFYAPHLVQMMTEIFGIEVRSVKATRMEDGVAAIYKYDDFCVSAHFGTGYTAAVYNEKETVEWHKVTVDGCTEEDLEVFYHMVKTGRGIEDYRAFAAPVYIIDATIKAYEQGTEVEIVIPEL